MNSIIKYSKIYALKYKYSFFVGLTLVVVGQILFNLQSLLVKYIFEAIEEKTSYNINTILVIFFALGISYTIINPIANTIHDNYLIKASKEIRLRVFKHLHALDFAFHAEKKSGSLISKIKRGDNAFWTYNIELGRFFLRTLVDLVFISVTFLLIDPLLVLVIFIGFLANLVFTFFMIKYNLKTRKGLNKQEDKITGIIADNLINYETVKYFAQEKAETTRLAKVYQDWTRALWKFANSFRIIELWIGTLITISFIFIFIYGIDGLQNDRISTGDFVLIITFSLKFFPRLADTIFRFRELAKNQEDFRDYLNLLEYPVEIVEKDDAIDLKINDGEIKFDDICFNYKGRNSVMDDFSLTIKPRESVALVGVSGAGKTTLIKLLLRFYDVNSGSIEIDGIDIKDLTKESLRQNIGIVPQEAVLFNQSIKFNLAYAKPDCSMHQIQEAARLANLDEFIESLPEKYDTLVGERGIKLSGGQKQRLAIARTIIENPPIIVFDEATSQLDSKSERAIQDAFWKIAKNKTTILIAHRLSTIRKVDRIIVLDKGKIVEEGTHNELIHKPNGQYQSLWDMQTGELRE